MPEDNKYRQVECPKDLYTILCTMMDADGDFVSGSALAKTLGISRPAVWGKLEKLRETGFEVEAVRNRGYRFTSLPDVIQPGLTQYYLRKNQSAITPLYFPVIDSTNNEAERQLSFEQKSPFAVLSSCQTKGRGRLGRDWHSASAENLYLSVLFEPNIPPQQLQHFTLWAGIYICRALQQFVLDAPLKIKWPNDLHCDGRKFAGMLTEARMDADRLRSIVFGIGINLNSNPNTYPAELRKTATSLHAVNGEPLSINLVAAQVLKAIEAAYAACIEGSGSESLVEAWQPLSALSGKPVTAICNGAEISGIARGIDDSGALLLEKSDGTLQAIRAGDVTLKK